MLRPGPKPVYNCIEGDSLGLIDVKFTEKLVETIKELNIGYNKKEIKIDATDKSTNVTVNITINVTPSTGKAFMLSSARPEKLLKKKTIQAVKNAINEKPQEMAKIVTTYNPIVIATSAASIVASNIGHLLKPEAVPLPAGDFIEALPPVIEGGTNLQIKFIQVGK